MSKQLVSVLVTDLDNTLFDWFEFWYHSFSAMLDRLAKDSGIAKEALISEIKLIHERHQTSEYAFLIQELPSLQERHPNKDLAETYNDAIHEYRKARIQHLKLYPGVMDTLRTLKEKGTLIIAYTESMGFYTNDRIRRLELDGIIDFVYSPEDHELPPNMTAEQIRKYPAEHYRLKYTQTRHTPKGQRKPNPELLLKILKEVDVKKEMAIYIGDSLFKDVVMAQKAGVTDVYAHYGKSHTKAEYELLRAVTHWPSEDVENEKKLSESDVDPKFRIDGGFSQLLALFNFTRYSGSLMPPPEDKIENLIEIWKTTIDVQKHFNDLGLRVRNFAITVTGAILGAAGFAVKEGLSLTVFGFHVPLSAFLVFVGLLSGIGFWLMDRHWYHRLLLGAVKHGESIEKTLETVLPEISLTRAITLASPTKIGKWEIHSSTKMDFFYGLGAIGLIALMLLFLFTVKPVAEPKRTSLNPVNSPTKEAAPVNSKSDVAIPNQDSKVPKSNFNKNLGPYEKIDK
jgi:phosphoglycolate phosphatase-like HAD superfamily hydrolase